ncbi:hypothetical protein FHG87_024973 [Trinorchestia longiramus]|nr:hypothetical protein FHG87_024973 [Trinorchestia longiramus]
MIIMGNFALIQKLFYSRACNQASQNAAAASYVNWTAEPKTSITSYGTGLRQNFTLGQKNVAHDPLVPKENIYLLPMHLKLGLIKHFVKAMDKTDDAFQFLKTKLHRLSEAKINERVFAGPQIGQLFQDLLIEYLNQKEKRVLLAFENVYENISSNNKSYDYVAHARDCCQRARPWDVACLLKCMSFTHVWASSL